MRSLIIIEVEHGETTDGVNEALFNMGIGSALNPRTDDQWPTGDDGETWMHLHGMDYEILDYSVAVDIPQYLAAININSVIERA
jgi:hypothetical protein